MIGQFTFANVHHFMPHGHCYLWIPSLVFLHVISDGLIALAYMIIPMSLAYLIYKRKDIPFDGIILCFAIFIIACGCTHAMEIWTLWHGDYWLSGFIKAITAVASLVTSFLVIRLIPLALTLPSPTMLRKANESLIAEIEERKKLELKNNELNSKLILAARQAGMADIAKSVLHNIGNILNSVNISATMMNNRVTQSKRSDFTKLVNLLQQHQTNLESFLTSDKRGQRVIPYLDRLSKAWQGDEDYLLEEVASLTKNGEHIKNIITQQQSLSDSIGFNEQISISELIEHSLALNERGHNIQIIREYQTIAPVVIDKVKLMQIVFNLLKNSIDSLQESTIEAKQLILRIQEKNSTHFNIQIEDNGIGISPEYITRIFSYGFTTKKTGHGYGLHSSAIIAQELSGSLSVESEGLGKGAVFTLTLPFQPEQ